MKLTSHRHQMRKKPQTHVDPQFQIRNLPNNRGLADSKEDPMGTPIRTIVISESFGLLDEISRLLLVQSDIDLAGLCNHGDDALEEVGSLLPQLVVMDLRMPGMNGLETADRLRRNFPAICIIMTSSAVGSEIESHCRNYGVDHFISSKRLRSDLLPTIQRAIAHPASEDRSCLHSHTTIHRRTKA